MRTEKPVEFLFTNKEFQKINAKLHDFNPLRILKVDRYEIRHSNILAWLFDPNGHHNLGDQFFKSFMIKVLPRFDTNNQYAVTSKDIAQANFQDLIVQREEDNIDLLLTSELSNLLVFIENKLYSKEGEDQLKKYAERIHERKDVRKDSDCDQSDKKTPIGIFLTLDGAEPETSDKFNYHTASYDDILQLVNLYLDTQSDRMSTRVYDFLNDYKDVLEEALLTKSTLYDECKSIYDANSAIIEELLEVNKDNESEESINSYRSIINQNQEATLKIIFEKATEIRLDMAAEKFAEAKELSHVKQTGIFSVFLTNQMKLEVAKQPKKHWNLSDYPYCLWFKLIKDKKTKNKIEGKLRIIISVGPFDDPSKRISFLEHLHENKAGVTEGKIKDGVKSTRIYSDSKSIKDLTDSEEIYNKMIELYEEGELKTVLENFEKTVHEFEW